MIDADARRRRAAGKVGPAFVFDPDGAVRLRSPRIRMNKPLKEAIGRSLVKSSRRSFEQQRSPAGVPWLARRVPNVAGMISDFTRGPWPKPTRFLARPALVDNGTLYTSISYRVEGARVVPTAGVPYAALMADGGVSTIAVTPAARRAARKWVGSSRDADALRVLAAVKKDSVTIRVPSRPFLGADRECKLEVSQLVGLAPFMQTRKRR